MYGDAVGAPVGGVVEGCLQGEAGAEVCAHAVEEGRTHMIGASERVPRGMETTREGVHVCVDAVPRLPL